MENMVYDEAYRTTHLTDCLKQIETISNQINDLFTQRNDLIEKAQDYGVAWQDLALMTVVGAILVCSKQNECSFVEAHKIVKSFRDDYRILQSRVEG